MKNIHLYISVIAALFLSSCEKERPDPTNLNTKITISIEVASHVTTNTATLHATLGNTTGQTVQDFGHCWSTNLEPTVADSKTSFGSTKEGKSFQSNIVNIQPETMYYTRAYFEIGDRIFYSKQIDFFTPSGMIMDIDGNEYGTIVIGNQEWMKENLKVTHYADGTAISNVTKYSDWGALEDDAKAYCWYDNLTTNRDIYGGLYTWSASMNGAPSSETNPSDVQGVCPDSWHLPSDEEWNELINHLGGKDLAGGKLKSTGYFYWKDPNYGATNESGFTALPSGYINIEYFGGLGERVIFWVAQESSDSVAAYCRILYTGASHMDRSYSLKNSGHAVRCVKD